MSDGNRNEESQFGVRWEGVAACNALRAIQAAAVCRSRDRLRPVLGGVLLTQDHAVATDSYALAIVTLDYQERDLVLPADVVDELVKMKAPKPYESFSLSIEEHTLTVTVDILRAGKQMTVEGGLEGAYPNWHFLTVDPGGVEKLEKIGYSPMLLGRLAQIVKVLGGNDNTCAVLMHLPNTKQPSMFRIDVADVASVDYWLMPVKLSD